MKDEMQRDRFVLNDDVTDRLVAAALRDDADIPAVSAAFVRNCMSAASGRRGGAAGRRLFRVAASAAFLASIATGTVTVAIMAALARQGAAEPTALAVAVEDVSTVGVNTPRQGRMVAASAGEGAVSALALSNECMVNTDPGATVFWKALNAGQSQMAWEWPDGAKSAKLTITGCGMTAEKVYGKTDAFPVWNPPVPEDFNEDDVYTARLTFYRGVGGTGGEVARLVANGIGFVRGVSGAGPHVAGDDVANANLVMFGTVRWVVRGK